MGQIGDLMFLLLPVPLSEDLSLLEFICFRFFQFQDPPSAQTISQPECAIASLKVKSEAVTISLNSLRSYPSFQRHRRCFLISSRIPSIHSQKGKFLSFIFSWNSEYGKAGMGEGRTGKMGHELKCMSEPPVSTNVRSITSHMQQHWSKSR